MVSRQMGPSTFPPSSSVVRGGGASILVPGGERRGGSSGRCRRGCRGDAVTQGGYLGFGLGLIDRLEPAAGEGRGRRPGSFRQWAGGGGFAAEAGAGPWPPLGTADEVGPQRVPLDVAERSVRIPC
jgi:hypothetical protein